MRAAGHTGIPRTIPILLIVCLFVLPAQAQYSGGCGTADDPYQIATAADLIALGETPDDYDKHFILTADIDLDPNLPGGRVFDRAVIAPDTNGVETGFQGTSFTGVFDGNGRVISHLSIDGAGYLGLFGRLRSGGLVRNLGVKAADVTGTSDCVGGLAGSSAYDCRIGTSYCVGSVSGNRSVGGLVGANSGPVIQCYAIAVVSGHERIGGLVGDNTACSISNCYSTGTVSGDDCVGGLVGYKSVDSVSSCYSFSTVLGDKRVGGLVGENGWRGRVIRSYSAGAVTGNSDIGGLVGWGNAVDVMNCFWDIQTSGQATSAGGLGKTTVQMKTPVTFLSWGACGNEGIWAVDQGRDYPRLWWENRPGEPIFAETTLTDFLAGLGTEDSPYLICTADELNLIGLFPCEWDKHFKLMADIDLSEFDGKDARPTFNMIGWGPPDYYGVDGTPFTGVFDGDGHTISGFTYALESRYSIGLFGYIDGLDAEVRDLRLANPTVAAGSGSDVGAMVGHLGSGTLTYCHVESGSVSGNSGVGGLVGSCGGGVVVRCDSSARVVGVDSVGGLVGRNMSCGEWWCGGAVLLTSNIVNFLT